MKTLCSALTALLLAVGSTILTGRPALASEEAVTVAVFDFATIGFNSRGSGSKITALVTAHLTAEPQLVVVERAELKKSLGEQEFGLSGNINSDTAAKIGQLTGAKVLVTGRAFRTDPSVLVIVANIIGTETSRVYAETVKGPPNDLAQLSEELSKQIIKTALEQATNLVVHSEARPLRVERIIRSVKGSKRPTVLVNVLEQAAEGQLPGATVDTELGSILLKAGFAVVDQKSERQPDVEILGCAVTSVGEKRGNLFPCRASVEVKVREHTSGKILALDRQTSEVLDIGKETGAKTALESAADQLAARIVPLIAE